MKPIPWTGKSETGKEGKTIQSWDIELVITLSNWNIVSLGTFCEAIYNVIEETDRQGNVYPGAPTPNGQKLPLSVNSLTLPGLHKCQKIVG